MNALCGLPIGTTGRTCILRQGHGIACEGETPKEKFVRLTPPATAFTRYYDTKHSCPTLDRALDDEPIFVIKATDETASAVIQLWLSLNPQITPEKRERVLVAIQACSQWKKKRKAD